MLKQKRGMNQIDWAISLAIFLLYVAWFFIIVKPQVLDMGVFSPRSDDLMQRFSNLTSQEIHRIPVFISSDSNLDSHLFEIDTSMLKDHDYGFGSDVPYLIDDDTIYLVDDLDNSTKTYNILESEGINFNKHSYFDYGITEGNGSVNPNSNITIHFSSIIDSIYFESSNRIQSITYLQNDQEISPQNFSFESKYLYAGFKTTFDTFTIEDNLVAGSNLIQSRVKKTDSINDINISLKFDILNFTDYFIDNSNYGSILDLDEECVTDEGKSIKVIDENIGLYFIFNKRVDISICSFDENSIFFNFPNQNLKYYMGFGNNDSSDIPSLDEEYTVDFGLEIDRSYPLLSKIENISSDSFDIEDINGFILTVFNTTSKETSIREKNVIKRISKGTNITENIYSEDSHIIVQDENANRWRMTLNVKVW